MRFEFFTIIELIITVLIVAIGIIDTIGVVLFVIEKLR